jgi:hypothetical protein
LLEKEELSFYEPASAVLSLDYLKDFLEFCDALLELDYILIKGDLETQYPVYAQDGTFVPGKTTGMVALFDFDSKNMIDNFVYEVESSESVSSLTTQSPDDVLLSDFLNQISTYISAEVQARYTVDPAVELPFFTNTDSEVLR